jgi:hypothetical protein
MTDVSQPPVLLSRYVLQRDAQASNLIQQAHRYFQHEPQESPEEPVPAFADREIVKECTADLLAFVRIRRIWPPLFARLVEFIHKKLADDFFLGYLARRLRHSIRDGSLRRLVFLQYESGLIPIGTITRSIFASIVRSTGPVPTAPVRPPGHSVRLGERFFASFLSLPNYPELPAILSWFVPEMEAVYPLPIREFLAARATLKASRGGQLLQPRGVKKIFPIWKRVR